MRPNPQQLVELETSFWQSMVDNDTDTALALLHEPSVMVSAQGAMKFDHDGYRKMADEGSMVVKAFELSDIEVVFPNDDTAVVTYHVKQRVAKRGARGAGKQSEMNDSSTWVKSEGDRWKCVMHTEAEVH